MIELGPIFAENIAKDKNIQYKTKSLRNYGNSRFYIFIALLTIGFGILIIRLFGLTVIEGTSFKKLAIENRLREVNLPSPRGIIYDRNKNPLGRNIPVFKTVDDEIFFNKPADAQGKAKELFIESATREYIYGDLLGNLLGYIGEVAPSDLKKLTAQTGNKEIKPLKLKDLVGKMGIEEAYDRQLRGVDGQELFEVDANGKYVRTLGSVESSGGQNNTLNIDLTLTKLAAALMQGKKGAVVASIPATGEILVLYSSPNFDPNKILKAEDLEAIFESQDKPLFNRSISGTYPPGSTFKIITALAGLESGAINRHTLIEDTGVIKIGENFTYKN